MAVFKGRCYRCKRPIKIFEYSTKSGVPHDHSREKCASCRANGVNSMRRYGERKRIEKLILASTNR